MFLGCSSFKNMEELRYLNTENVTNFSYIFAKYEAGNPFHNNRFHSFTNINFLSTWNVSNGINFSDIFKGCQKLSNIKALENWDVSNGIHF